MDICRIEWKSMIKISVISCHRVRYGDKETACSSRNVSTIPLMKIRQDNSFPFFLQFSQVSCDHSMPYCLLSAFTSFLLVENDSFSLLMYSLIIFPFSIQFLLFFFHYIYIYIYIYINYFLNPDHVFAFS